MPDNTLDSDLPKPLATHYRRDLTYIPRTDPQALSRSLKRHDQTQDCTHLAHKLQNLGRCEWTAHSALPQPERALLEIAPFLSGHPN